MLTCVVNKWIETNKLIEKTVGHQTTYIPNWYSHEVWFALAQIHLKKTKPGFYVYGKVLALQFTAIVNQHLPAHHPLDAHCDSVVDEP
jgi:hypothetical protein